MRKISCDDCSVRGPGAVCDVPSDALADFRAVGVTSVYKPHQVVFTAGNPCSGLYLVCHGAVKLYHSDRFGRDHILEIAGPRALLGELAAESDEPLSVSAETLTETQLCFLSRDRLVRFLAQDPMIGVRMLEALSRELALARHKVRDLALKRADSRLAALLLDMARGEDGLMAPQLRLDYTRRELAEMIGVSTETAIRLLAKFRREKLIEIRRNVIVLHDFAKLARIANYGDVEE